MHNHPFLLTRPAISIVESSEHIADIDCLELQWWFAIPRLGDHTMSASYEADTLELSAVTDLRATGLATLHQVDCVEIEVAEWAMRDDMILEFVPGFFYSTIEQEKSRWIGVVKTIAGSKVFSTLRDDGFEHNWGAVGKRRLYDDGRYQLQPDGSYRITDSQGLGTGVYDVTIGEKTFCYLRVLDVGSAPSEYDEFGEAFVEQGGRTIFYRQYRDRLCGAGEKDWAETYPNNPRLVINGCVFVHCDCTGRAHDVITNTSVCVPL